MRDFEYTVSFIYWSVSGKAVLLIFVDLWACKQIQTWHEWRELIIDYYILKFVDKFRCSEDEIESQLVEFRAALIAKEEEGKRKDNQYETDEFGRIMYVFLCFGFFSYHFI